MKIFPTHPTLGGNLTKCGRRDVPAMCNVHVVFNLICIPSLPREEKSAADCETYFVSGMNHACIIAIDAFKNFGDI